MTKSAVHAASRYTAARIQPFHPVRRTFSHENSPKRTPAPNRRACHQVCQRSHAQGSVSTSTISGRARRNASPNPLSR